jgi:hypothetical protein
MLILMLLLIFVSFSSLKAFLKCNETAINSSPSPVALNIQSIIGTAPIPADKNYKGNFYPEIGTGSQSNLVFTPKVNTTFPMDFTLTYKPDPQLGLLRDPAFAEFMNVCGITSRRRRARIEYKAVATVAILKSLGYTPVLEGFINIDCPASQDQVDAVKANVQTALEEGRSAFDALKEVFGDSAPQIGEISSGSKLFRWMSYMELMS